MKNIVEIVNPILIEDWIIPEVKNYIILILILVIAICFKLFIYPRIQDFCNKINHR